MANTNPQRRLADMILARPVFDVIADMRDAGKSYRTISVELRDLTNCEIDVTDVTIRNWDLLRQSTQHAASLTRVKTAVA